MIIHSNNEQVAEKLKALESVLVENGAWFHENLTIVVTGSNLSMEMTGPVQQQIQIIKVPSDLVVPWQALNLTVKNNKLYCDPDMEVLSPVQNEIAHHMLDIFNLTDKLNAHSKECVFVKYKGARQLLEPLLAVRNDTFYTNTEMNFFKGNAEALPEENFLAWSFMQSRVLCKADDVERKYAYMMPIIDCLNHDHRGSLFDFQEDGLCIRNAQPFPGTAQCYAHYGYYDTLDMFITYGFIDKNIPYSISVPMEIALSDTKKLRIDNFGLHKSTQPIPPQLQNLADIMPDLIQETEDVFSIRHLFIPSTVLPHSMRRILQAVITTILGVETSQEEIMTKLLSVEKQIIDANIQFYKDVLKKIETIDAPEESLKEDICEVAMAQINKLYKYPFM